MGVIPNTMICKVMNNVRCTRDWHQKSTAVKQLKCISFDHMKQITDIIQEEIMPAPTIVKNIELIHVQRQGG